jgi:hypothetical protein
LERTDLLHQHRKSRVRFRLAVILILGAVFISPALAEPTDLAKLAANPLDYLDKEVEVTGHCLKNGAKGDVIGYECTTDGPVWVNANSIEPDAVREKLDGECSGKDDESCRVTIRFVPRSFSTSGFIEPGKTITIFNTGKAELSF